MTCTTHETDTDSRIRQLLADHGSLLTRYVERLTAGQRQTAEDLVQETMIRAWRNLDSLPSDLDGERRWLFTVARRLVIDDIRRRQVRPAEVGPIDVDSFIVSDSTCGAAIANRTLHEAARMLSASQRKVLHEVFILNHTIADVAVRLNVPVGTVRSRLHYALRAVRAAVVGS